MRALGTKQPSDSTSDSVAQVSGGGAAFGHGMPARSPLPRCLSTGAADVAGCRGRCSCCQSSELAPRTTGRAPCIHAPRCGRGPGFTAALGGQQEQAREHRVGPAALVGVPKEGPGQVWGVRCCSPVAAWPRALWLAVRVSWLPRAHSGSPQPQIGPNSITQTMAPGAQEYSRQQAFVPSASLLCPSECTRPRRAAITA